MAFLEQDLLPNININKSFVPVINDVSFRIMLIAKLIWGIKASIVDVETAVSYMVSFKN
jgi:hypothetical protein